MCGPSVREEGNPLSRIGLDDRSASVYQIEIDSKKFIPIRWKMTTPPRVRRGGVELDGLSRKAEEAHPGETTIGPSDCVVR